MISRILVKIIHVFIFIVTAGTCACLYVDVFKKADENPFDYQWLKYYLLSVYAIGAVQTLLWIFQSRIYENGRPSVQECVISLILSVLYLFAAAWQFYQTFANDYPTQFICSTDTSDMTLHCRLWQSQLVGAAACGVILLFASIFFILLFRSRPLVIKELPDDIITSSPIMSPASSKRTDIESETAAAEAEADRRRLEYREQTRNHQQPYQQQQQQRPYQQQPVNPYQQQQQQQQQPNPYQQQHYQTKRVVPGPAYNQHSNIQLLHHQNSSGLINQNQYQQPATPSPHQDHAARVSESGDYYNGNYAGQRQNTSFDLTQPPQTTGYQIKAPIISGGYTEEPNSYQDAPTVSNAQYQQDFPAYAYGQFDPNETFDDPTSQEAQAHLAYANQLREQQLYHQNMGEFLQKQSQQRKQQMQKQQDYHPPTSGSTVDFYPPPPRQNTNQWGSSTNLHSYSAQGSRDDYSPYSAPPNPSYNTGMVTPGSNSGIPRMTNSPKITGSPQMRFPDDVTVAESTYSDDRHKGNLVNEIRRARMEDERNRSTTPVENQEYHDYKVQIATSPRVHNPNYVPSSN